MTAGRRQNLKQEPQHQSQPEKSRGWRRVYRDGRWWLDLNEEKRRIVVHLATTPTRGFFLAKWKILNNAITDLDQTSDGEIDLVFDYTEASPLPNTLKLTVFTKTIGMAMSFPNLYVWRIIKDPDNNLFLQQVMESVPTAWMGTIRVMPRTFHSFEEMDEYLDEYRGQKPKGWYWEPPENGTPN